MCALHRMCTGASSWLQRVPRNRALRMCCAPYSMTLRMCCGVAQRVSTALALLPLVLLVIWRQVRPTIADSTAQAVNVCSCCTPSLNRRHRV